MEPNVGVILLDSQLHRPVGDIGNPDTFAFPVRYLTATGAYAPHVVEQGATGLLDTFVTAGRALVRHGVRALSTSCGFLSIYQRQLADATGATVATSALLQAPVLLRMLPDDALLGVITANAASLSGAHLEAAGITAADRYRLEVIGLERTSHFYPTVVRGEGRLDPSVARAEVLGAAATAVARTPRLRAFLLECANLPPYAAALRSSTGLPVWDVTTMLNWVQQGL